MDPRGRWHKISGWGCGGYPSNALVGCWEMVTPGEDRDEAVRLGVLLVASSIHVRISYTAVESLRSSEIVGREMLEDSKWETSLAELCLVLPQQLGGLFCHDLLPQAIREHGSDVSKFSSRKFDPLRFCAM